MRNIIEFLSHNDYSEYTNDEDACQYALTLSVKITIELLLMLGNVFVIKQYYMLFFMLVKIWDDRKKLDSKTTEEISFESLKKLQNSKL